MMFILFPVKGWWRIGFTVMDSGKAIEALGEIGLAISEYHGRGTRTDPGDR